MEQELTNAIHPIMMDRDTTLMDKEAKIVNRVAQLSLGFVVEAVMQLGFSQEGLKNNLGIKAFLREHYIPYDQFKKALAEANSKVKQFKPSSH